MFSPTIAQRERERERARERERERERERALHIVVELYTVAREKMLNGGIITLTHTRRETDVT